MNLVRIASPIGRWVQDNSLREHPTVTLSFTNRDAYMRAEIAIVHELWEMDQRGQVPSLAGGFILQGIHFVLELKGTK